MKAAPLTLACFGIYLTAAMHWLDGYQQPSLGCNRVSTVSLYLRLIK